VSPLPKKVSSRQIVSLGHMTIWYVGAWDPDMRWIRDIITWMHVCSSLTDPVAFCMSDAHNLKPFCMNLYMGLITEQSLYFFGPLKLILWSLIT